jgi:peptide/nickel transport system ATP-binding protein
MTADALRCDDLSIVSRATGAHLIENVSFCVDDGEFLGLVGESGSGKTTIGFAFLGFVRSGTKVAGGGVRVGAADPLSMAQGDLLALRRTEIAYVPQSAGYALNPALHIERQLRDRLPDVADAGPRLLYALDQVSLPATNDFLRRYPHQLSGGQQQRVAIASALITNPRIIIFDEPTTGLDAAVQAQVLEMIRKVCVERGLASLFISHDLAAVASLCSRTVVMRNGRVVEQGATSIILRTPDEPYTKTLVQAVPSLTASMANARAREAEAKPDAREGGDRKGLVVRGLVAAHGHRPVLHDIDLTFEAGECTAIVGESGSGKTTLCRTLIGLHTNYSGTVSLDGAVLEKRARQRPLEHRRLMQYVFQNPYDSLNPRRTVSDIILDPVRFLGRDPPANFVGEQLERVRLRPEFAGRYPHQLSGGERQRVAFARSLAVNPSVIICDEVTSALDVSVQASIVDLILRLRREMGLTVIFVTHNLALVPEIAESVAVLKNGRIVDRGRVPDVFGNPRSDYTRSLLALTVDLKLVEPPSSRPASVRPPSLRSMQ